MTQKGQVTVPKAVREHLGAEPGTRIDFEVIEDGRVVITVAAAEKRVSRFRAFAGHAGQGMMTDEIMALTRGEK